LKHQNLTNKPSLCQTLTAAGSKAARAHGGVLSLRSRAGGAAAGAPPADPHLVLLHGLDAQPGGAVSRAPVLNTPKATAAQI